MDPSEINGWLLAIIIVGCFVAAGFLIAIVPFFQTADRLIEESAWLSGTIAVSGVFIHLVTKWPDPGAHFGAWLDLILTALFIGGGMFYYLRNRRKIREKIEHQFGKREA